jgi:hypothetical protein
MEGKEPDGATHAWTGSFRHTRVEQEAATT